ncbi:MAG: hypothetical protein COB67_00330 [SAR324 cluster bacterium]|uniref:Type-F conjugative transfer system pilin assembly protein TrbC n=1 Tax=SAR324 cluster bacterium TaxID=2024889 RepID=A0A2A4TBE6_9DELT|nr:MAG: hypothetical protein COB67_00330 [SAR324 cluster bacterium]
MRWVLTVVLIMLVQIDSFADIKNNPFYKQLDQTQVQSFKNKIKEGHQDKQAYFFYFLSSSLPKKYLIGHARSMKKIMDVDTKVHSVQFIRGIDGGFGEYLSSFRELDIQILRNIQGIVNIRPNEKLFEELNITKIPAIVYAECSSNFFHDCDYKYITRGVTTMDETLKLMEDDNDLEQFERWREILKDSSSD